MKGVNDKPGTPNYDMYQKALKSTSQRLYPNYTLSSWENNNNAIEYNAKVKTNVINSLSENEYEKLVKFGELHPIEFAKLGLYLN